MSSTTIRYSGVPENSHSRRFDPEHSVEPVSGITADASIYSRPAPAAGFDRGPESDLTLKWRKRLRALADEDPAPGPDSAPDQAHGQHDNPSASRSRQAADRLNRPGRFTDRSDRSENLVASGYDLAGDHAASGYDLAGNVANECEPAGTRAARGFDSTEHRTASGHDSAGDHTDYTANGCGPERDRPANGSGDNTATAPGTHHDPAPDQAADQFKRGSDPATGPDLGAESAATDFVPGFTPGKAGPTSPDPRHNRAFPHPQNPGLFTEVDGFYDWANRRLYLTDGSPDPLTPGAYRYQTRPDLCDLDAPDSDPASPRYEPMHLRHKPGDTWLIDRSRPYDALDPGPFGSPGWFPDRRTGRHRRDELPDPIPWWEIEEEPEKAEWAEQAEALWERRTRITREREARESNQRETTANNHNATTDRAPSTPRGSADRDNTDPPEPPVRQSVPEDRPRRQAATRPQPWARSEPEGRESFREPPASQPPQHHPHVPRQADRRATDIPVEPPHRFNKLREDAWDRFIEKSADLAAAHRSQTAIERECGPTIGRIARGIRLITGLLRHRPKPRADKPVPPDRRTALAARTARFAGAVRGAQRARAASARPQTRTDSARPHTRTGSARPEAARRHVQGGVAWA
ncbi:hypothetical protein O1R50_19365 [Glycomyces luteolus]|uniref:Uncharacterized protein n=1 Tax=Glycomyces luteolus TaxID=2670330 RepID=A0A9X3SRT9_9ACTN|nr:hypothetical protein [Glycomyces luteolus]MDA1361796.1 hypothetical protein [Glycomyces luteolus]